MKTPEESYIKGIEQYSAEPVYINARLKLSKEMPLRSDFPVDSRRAAENLIFKYLVELPSEYFCVLNMNAREKPINFSVTSIGGIAEAPVPINMVLARTLLSNAKAVEVFHNHPSGDIDPSQCDKDLTERFKDACRLMRIKYIDHCIVGSDDYNHPLIYRFQDNPPQPDARYVRETYQQLSLPGTDDNVLRNISLKLERNVQEKYIKTGKDVPRMNRIGQVYGSVDDMMSHFQSLSEHLQESDVVVMYMTNRFQRITESVWSATERHGSSPEAWFFCQHGSERYKDILETAIKLNANRLSVFINSHVNSDDLRSYHYMMSAFSDLLEIDTVDVATPTCSDVQIHGRLESTYDQRKSIREKFFQADRKLNQNARKIQSIKREPKCADNLSLSDLYSAFEQEKSR